jgi:RNA polymerase sigma-70 factor (ECF subfamily)
MEQPDRDILELFAQSGYEQQAFTQLVKKYQKPLYWHIRKMVIDHDDTDDVLQNVFIKAYKGLHGFREDAKLSTWLYKIATNETLTFLNQKKKRFLLPLADVEQELSQKIDELPGLNANQIEVRLQKALLKLPEKQRLVFNMKYFDELKYEEMSEILGTSVGALKASYHIAVKKIEEFLSRF